MDMVCCCDGGGGDDDDDDDGEEEDEEEEIKSGRRSGWVLGLLSVLVLHLTFVILPSPSSPFLYFSLFPVSVRD